MSDRLVVEKSARQRRIEGVILFVMPPIVALACRVCLGPGLWQIPIILLGFVIISVVGNVVAVRSGGELMAPAERYRRTLARIASDPLWSVLLWTFAFYFSLLSSLTMPMTDQGHMLQLVTFQLPLAVAGALLATGICVFYLRKVASKTATAMPPLPKQLPWIWLRNYVPFRAVTMVGIVFGYFAALGFSDPTNLLILMAGFTVGQIIETVLLSRRIKNAPLLWSDLGFFAALVTAIVQGGIPFALFVGFMGALTAGKFDIVSAVFALAGFVGGVFLVLCLWAVRKINTVKAKA